MNNKILLLSFLLSLSLHSLLLLGLVDFSATKDKTHFSKKSGDALAKVRVQLRDKIVPKKKPLPINKNAKRSIEKAPELEKKETTPRPEEVSSVATAEAAGKQSIIASYLTSLRTQIVKFQYKNRISKRLNLKGEVKISFNVAWPNTLEELKVLNSSGNEALDLSAIESVQRIPEIPSLPNELEGSTVPVKVTLVYD